VSPLVLVTGAAGYLGSILCEHLLARGYRVTAVDSLMYGVPSLLHLCGNPNFTFERADVRDQAAMRRLAKDADIIVPLAAIVGAPACDKDPGLATAVNLEAVRFINAIRSPAQRLIYMNTNSGYGISSGEVHCTEDSPLEPISLYGRTKVDAERAVLGSPNTVVLRLATVFGASPRLRIDLLVNHFVYAAVTDGFLVIFEKDFKRNFVHIRDVADCICYAIEHDGMTGRVFNLGLDSANLSKEELALKVKAQVPNFFLHFAAIGQDPDKRNYIVSNQRLREAGFEARRSLDDGIRELLSAYRMLARSVFKNV
jgi:nucleoside-diphosphate-sugar epimerase